MPPRVEPRQMIEEMFAAFGAGGAEAWAAYLTRVDGLHPEFVMAIHPDLLVNAGEWHGISGFEEMSRSWLEVWEDFEIVTHETIELGRGYLIPSQQRGVAKGSGMAVSGEFFFTAEFEGGRIRRIGLYGDRAPAEADLAADRKDHA